MTPRARPDTSLAALAAALMALVPAARAQPETQPPCEVALDLPGLDYRLAEDCPPIFGDQEAHARNEEERLVQLLELEWRPGRVRLVHNGPWRGVAPLAFEDVRLLTTWTRPGCEPQALLELLLGAGACPAGLYLVGVDHALGEHARVLAILPELLLVEHRGALGYLATPEAAETSWQVSWAASWILLRPPPNSGASSPPPPARPQPGRRR